MTIIRPRAPSCSCVYEGLQLPIDAGAAGRIALLHQDPALQGSRGDDPQPVPVDAGTEQGRAASAERAADQGEETRRDRRRLHGRQRRLRLGARRHRRGADRPRPGKRRQGQGPRQGRDRRSDQEGPRQGKRSRRHSRPHQRDRRLQRPEGLRPHHRGGVRGSQGQGGDLRQGAAAAEAATRSSPPTPRRCRSIRWRRSSRTRASSSASISSRRSRR